VLIQSAHLFVDVDKAKKDLDAFALANDARMYKLFKACVDPQSDLRTIVKSRVGLARSGTSQQSHLSARTSLTLTSSFPARAPAPTRAIAPRPPRHLFRHH
jgi:sister-chromatid-cohesion protein PDS5